jgi:hypothetical protein
MTKSSITTRVLSVLLLAGFCAAAVSHSAAPAKASSAGLGNAVGFTPLPQAAPNIGINGYTSTDKVQRGRMVQMAVVMDIPHGYHVNSNRPLESFLKATQLTVETTSGVRASAVIYPRALLRKFSFSKSNLSVYEGRVVLRFNVVAPAGFRDGNLEVKAKLNYQSCSDSLCYPPQSREVRVGLPVVSANESVKRINGEIFAKR